MEIPKCASCCNPYSATDLSREPRCLPCGHSFCTECLEESVGEHDNTCQNCTESFEAVQVVKNFELIKAIGNIAEDPVVGQIIEEFKKILAQLENNQTEKLEELKLEIDGLRKQMRTFEKKIPIREAIIGEWRLVDHKNFDKWHNKEKGTFEKFSGNVTYRLNEKGKLQQLENEKVVLTEGNEVNGWKYLFERDNHLRTEWKDSYSMDRFMLDGKLHAVERSLGAEWTRIYRKED